MAARKLVGSLSRSARRIFLQHLQKSTNIIPVYRSLLSPSPNPKHRNPGHVLGFGFPSEKARPFSTISGSDLETVRRRHLGIGDAPLFQRRRSDPHHLDGDKALSQSYRDNTTAGAGGFRSMNFVKSLSEDQSSRKKNRDFVHVLLLKKKTFVTVTDDKGNKKTGASAGSLEGRQGRSRLSRYAAEATAEHVGRAARKIGLKSVVMKVKGCTYFRKKKKVILSWREGFRGEGAGVGVKSRILSIHDVTQLPHNGCRLPKKRRV